jgi:hypothetical protein
MTPELQALQLIHTDLLKIGITLFLLFITFVVRSI